MKFDNTFTSSKRNLVAFAQRLLKRLVHAEIVRQTDLKFLKINSHKWLEVSRWQNSSVPDELYSYVTRNLSLSQSQLQQDLFANYVAENLGANQTRYFVEFGCTDGKRISNTWLLESAFNWQGVIAEPARIWHEELMQNRNCDIELGCIYKTSGEYLEFLETEEPEFSTINMYEKNDGHLRSIISQYMVPTISLNDLLEKYKAPKKINFLSIDTEGSEYEILSHFNFLDYEFDYISVEHNFGPNRENVKLLFENRGYSRILSEVSIFEDWYVQKKNVSKLFLDVE